VIVPSKQTRSNKNKVVQIKRNSFKNREKKSGLSILIFSLFYFPNPEKMKKRKKKA